MRLLTHNLLACQARGCVNTSLNFPLQLQNVRLEVQDAPLNAAFLRGLVPKLDWSALVGAAQALGDTSLPIECPGEEVLEHEADAVAQLQEHVHQQMRDAVADTSDGPDDDELWADAMSAARVEGAFTLKALHHVLMELQIVEGEMLCGNCGHVFRIMNGIPNMLLADHEIQK